MKQSRSLFNAAGCLLALTSLLINSSCSQDEFAMMPAQDGEARFSISLPGEIGTRSNTFGDVKQATVNTLYWTLFEITDSEMGGGTPSYKKVASSDIKGAFENDTQEVSLPLVVGKKYKITFCAMNSLNQLVRYEDGKLAMNYSAASCNSVDDDVFTGVSAEIDMKNYNGTPYTVELHRPLAQINWGSTDFKEAAVAAHIEDTEATVTYHSGLYSSLDIINGSVEDPLENSVSFPAISCKELPQMNFPVENSNATLVAMNYLLVGTDESATINCEMSFTGGFKTEVTVNSAPVQANYRTNIYGGLITNSGNVSVEMNKAFDSSSSERYLTPETRRVMNELKAKQSVIEIPEGETIDLTGLGTFYLTGGQTIKLDGALILDKQQLKLQNNSQKANIVKFEGKGIIYSTESNPVYILNGAKGIFNGIKIICESRSGVALNANGEIELNSVTIKSKSNGIYISDGGSLTAENCKIVADKYAVDLEETDKSNLSDCEIISSSSAALTVSDCNADLTNCSLYAHGKTNTINIAEGGNVHIYSSIVESEGASALYAEGYNAEVHVKAGYLHSKNKETIIVADEAKVTLDKDNNVIPVVVSESSAAIHVGENADATISRGRYLTFGDYAPVIISGYAPSLTISNGEFITNFDSSIMELEDCSGEILNLMGGEYSGGYMATNKNNTDLQPAVGYKLEKINKTTQEGFKLNYRISAINANN